MRREDGILDIFDEDYNHIGTDTFENIHAKGLWHHNIHCWMVNPKTDKIILILLSDKHLLMPKKFDVAIFGQMLAGEKILDGKKEIEKKFGLELNEEGLIKIGITKEISFVKSRNAFHRVFSHSYYYKMEKNLDEYLYNEETVEGIFEMSIKEALKLFSDKIDTAEVTGYINGNKEKIVRNVSYDDFAQRGKHYLYKVLFAIDYLLEEEEWEEKYKHLL